MNAGLSPGDRFVVVRTLGIGSMGEVRLAHDLEQGGLVALKTVGPCDDEALSEAKLWREGVALKGLDHPGIVKYLGTLILNGRFVIVQEFIDGITFRQWFNRLPRLRDCHYDFEVLLREMPAEESKDDIAWLEYEPKAEGDSPPEPEGGQLPFPPEFRRYIESKEYIARCCEMVRQAAEALGHAHERGVWHRDLKPENLMITRDGQVRIIDFGIARFEGAHTFSQSRAILGSPLYMSPEHITGRINVNEKSDVFSLGIVLFEALTLRCPYSAPSLQALYKQIATRPMPPLGRNNRGVSRELEAIVHKAINKNPEVRYENGGAFQEDLADFLAGKPVTAPRYRYKPDRSEIVAERPLRITIAMWLFYFVFIVTSMMLLSSLTLYTSNFTFTPTTAIATAIGFASLLSGWGLGHADRVAVWIAPCVASFIALGSMAAIIGGIGTPQNSAFAMIMYAIFVSVALYTMWAVLSRKSRHWYRYAEDIRSEQRGRPRLISTAGR